LGLDSYSLLGLFPIYIFERGGGKLFIVLGDEAAGCMVVTVL
jgi:hypothetical protein